MKLIEVESAVRTVIAAMDKNPFVIEEEEAEKLASLLLQRHAIAHEADRLYRVAVCNLHDLGLSVNTEVSHHSETHVNVDSEEYTTWASPAKTEPIYSFEAAYENGAWHQRTLTHKVVVA